MWQALDMWSAILGVLWEHKLVTLVVLGGLMALDQRQRA